MRRLIPPLLAALLAVPGFAFTYLFDDFDFLGRGLTPRFQHLLPDANSLFYRPVSRELYFGLLAQVSPTNPFLAHLANAVLLGIAVALLQRVFQRLLGARGAFVGATCFAVFSQIPLLIGWVSCVQDLLAICWLIVALEMELRGRWKVALVATAAGLLSKETVIACLPALAFAGTMAGPKRTRLVLSGLRYGVLAVMWALVHPGIHTLVSRGLASGGTGYVGIDNPERWTFLARSAIASLNFPVPGFPCPWPTDLTGLAVIVVAASFAARPALFLEKSDGAKATQPPAVRVAFLGILLAGPPAMLASILVRHWAPYYLCVPAVGVALLLGSALTYAQPMFIRTFLCGFALLGIWSRGMEIDPSVPTERNLRPASAALSSLEPQFKRLSSRFPARSRIYVSVFTHGVVSVHAHMYRFQVLRIWYRDPNLEVLRPDEYVRREGPESLFWISPDLTVYQIDLSTFLPRSVRAPADYLQFQKVMRAYARGLGKAGEVDEATRILLGMPEKTQAAWIVDRRLAAMILLQNGNADGASRVLSGVPDVPHRAAVRVVASLLIGPKGSDRDDEATLRAFGLSPADPAAVQSVLGAALDLGADPAARRLALRLLRMDPTNTEAQSALRTVTARAQVDRIVTPAFEPELP